MFDKFFQLTLNQYIERWQLQPDKIMDRPAFMNLSPTTVEYRYGFNQDGYDFLGKIFTDKRRQYPEASSGAVEGIVRGLTGVQPSAAGHSVTICPRLTKNTSWVTVENIPVFTGLISVSHQSATKTSFANKSDKALTWRAMFQGIFAQITAGAVMGKTD